MSNNGPRSPRNFLRGLLLVGGFGGLLWSAAALPSFSRLVPAREITARITADDRFKAAAMTDVLATIETEPAFALSKAEVLRAIALVRLRLAEDAMGRKNSEEADREIGSAEERVRSALAVSPVDSFLWLMLYSLQLTRSGFEPADIRWLDQSYATGPFEGWISLRRNRLALAAFPLLTSRTQDAVTSEFAQMVDSDFIADAARNFTTVGWVHRDLLLPKLERVDLATRQSLARRLSHDGYQVAIPGIELDDRLWR